MCAATVTAPPGPAGSGVLPAGPSLPEPRGPLAGAVHRRLLGGPVRWPSDERIRAADPLEDDDLHLALYLCYELSYRGFAGVDEDREWDVDLVSFRLRLERAFEDALRAAIPHTQVDPSGIAAEIRALSRLETGPSLSRFMEREAGHAAFREFMIHRSAYHLKEADPHSFAIPRLEGAAKAALVEIQADEYGGGDPSAMHAALFASSMRAMGLDPTYGAHLDRIPGATLALTNVMSLFGLHRRLRGALVGHLALFELTSSIPNRRYGNGLRRCGFGADATRFFDVHVEADAAHGAIASEDLAGGYVGADRRRASEVSFGAGALQLLETRVDSGWVRAWRSGASTLRLPGGSAR